MQGKVLQFGNPLLSEDSLPVQATKIDQKETQAIISKLISTLKKEKVVLLTAPQIGITKRIMVMESNPTKIKYKDKYRKQNFPLTVLINPWIDERSEEKIYDWEKCASMNENKLYAITPRNKWVKVAGFNEKGKRISFLATGFKARLIQHGIDHLNGISYFERMKKKTLKFISSDEEWLKYGKKVLSEFSRGL